MKASSSASRITEKLHWLNWKSFLRISSEARAAASLRTDKGQELVGCAHMSVWALERSDRALFMVKQRRHRVTRSERSRKDFLWELRLCNASLNPLKSRFFKNGKFLKTLTIKRQRNKKFLTSRNAKRSARFSFHCRLSCLSWRIVLGLYCLFALLIFGSKNVFNYLRSADAISTMSLVET